MPLTVMKGCCIEGGSVMAVIAAEERTKTPRRPERDCTVIRAFLRALGVACADAELIASVVAPIDVRFRDAQFHLRELRAHPPGRDGQDPAGVHQSHACEHRGDPHDRTEERQRAVLLPHVTAVLAPHAAWYGARCTGLDALVCVDACPCVLAPARLAVGVGVAAAFWAGAVCGERCTGVSARGDSHTVPA